MAIIKAGGGDTFKNVDAKLKHLEDHFDIKNPVGSRLNATLLGQELAKVALTGIEAFKDADRRLTAIAERLIGGEMGSIAGAVENAFHGGVSEGATNDLILRANKQAKKERGI